MFFKVALPEKTTIGKLLGGGGRAGNTVSRRPHNGVIYFAASIVA